MNNTTVKDIVDRAGGFIELSYELQITTSAVYAWIQRGIPRRYWKLLSERSGLDQGSIENAHKIASFDESPIAGDNANDNDNQ